MLWLDRQEDENREEADRIRSNRSGRQRRRGVFLIRNKGANPCEEGRKVENMD